MKKRRDALLSALNGGDPELSAVAAEALEKIQTRERLDFLSDKISNGEMLEKIRALYALVGLKGQHVIDLAAGALKDPSEDVRAAAARSLGDMFDPRVLKPLVEALGDDSPMVQRSLIDALARHNDPRLLGPLMKLLKNKDSGVIEKALEAVGNIGDKRAEEAMLFFAEKGNRKMKAVALKALGAMDA